MARESLKVRREKQRVRQRAYRARLKAEGKPSHEDIARALLDEALTVYLEHEKHLMSLGNRVSRRLREIGFHERETETVWWELVERCQRGWRLLRPRRPIAEMEADGLRDAE
jgi:hypothetical protein